MNIRPKNILLFSLGLSLLLPTAAPSSCVDYGPHLNWLATARADACRPYSCFVVTDSVIAATGLDGRLYIFEASDKGAPTLAATMSFDGEANAIYRHGDFALVSFREGSLLTVDLAQPLSPAIMDTVDIQVEGFPDMAFVDDLALVCTGDESGLAVLDVSDPAAASVLGMWKPNQTVNAVEASGGRVFALANHEFFELDLTDPVHPSAIDSLAMEGVDAFIIDGDRMATRGSGSYLTIYDLPPQGMPSFLEQRLICDGLISLAMSQGVLATGSHDGVTLFRVDSSGPIQELARIGMDNDALPGWLVQTEDYTYFAGSNGINILDLGNQEVVPHVAVLPVPGAPFVAMASYGDFVLAVAESDSLIVLDLHDPTNPVVAASVPLAGPAYALAIRGDQAFVGGDQFFSIFNITDPEQPQLIGFLEGLPGEAHAIALDGDTAWLGGYGPDYWTGNLLGIDISDPEAPVLRDQIPQDDPYFTLAAHDGLLHAVGYWGTYDIYALGTDPLAMSSRTETNIRARASLAFRDSLVLMGTALDGIRYFDVSDPTSPQPAGVFFMPNGAGTMTLDGDLACISDGDAGLMALDISDITRPLCVGTAMGSFYSHVVLPGGQIMGWGTASFHRMEGCPDNRTIVTIAPAPCRLVAGQPAPTQLTGIRLRVAPNPFNPLTTISFDMPVDGYARLDIEDVRGRKVRTLCNQEFPAGNQRMMWDGRDDSGRALASGVYLARLVHSGGVTTGKLGLIR